MSLPKIECVDKLDFHLLSSSWLEPLSCKSATYGIRGQHNCSDKPVLIKSFENHSVILCTYRIMLGKMDSWSIFALKCIPIVVSCFVAAYFLPESPRYLFLKGENVKAIEALTWFRVTTEKEQLDTEAKSVCEENYSTSHVNTSNQSLEQLHNNNSHIHRCIVLWTALTLRGLL